MTVRTAHSNDLPDLLELLSELEVFHLKDRPQRAQTAVAGHLEWLLEHPSHSLFVADSPDALIGYTSVHWLPYLFLPGQEGFLSELFVHPEARGRGVGTALMAAVLAAATARGCYRVSLLNMRDRDSYQRRFYRGLGFTERPDAANFIYTLDTA